MNASKTNNLKNKRSTANNLQSNRELDSLNYHELTELYSKTAAMLNNATIKLPDGGAKLKSKLEQIEKALAATENTSNLTQRVSDMSIADRPNTRKEALSHANKYPTESHKLLRAHSDMEPNARTSCIISLEESIQLQDSQQKDIKEANMKKRMESITRKTKIDSLTDELSSTMGRLRLDPETRVPRPDDDGSSDDEGPDADSIDDSDDDDDDLLYANDDEGFEEEEEEEEEQRRR